MHPKSLLFSLAGDRFLHAAIQIIGSFEPNDDFSSIHPHFKPQALVKKKIVPKIVVRLIRLYEQNFSFWPCHFFGGLGGRVTTGEGCGPPPRAQNVSNLGLSRPIKSGNFWPF